MCYSLKQDYDLQMDLQSEVILQMCKKSSLEEKERMANRVK